MTVSNFTMCESKVREAAATGTLVDLRVGDSAIASPENGSEWGLERTVRAEVITDILLGDSDTAAVPVRGVRVQGARITGELNLEAATLRCPLALLDCCFDSALNLNEATAVSVRLSGSHIPAIQARQFQASGDLRLDKDFCVSEGVDLARAHIRGQLNCTGGQFSNPDGYALNVGRLSVDQDMLCGEGFTASGEVRLLGAHIGGAFSCRGGQFSNPDGSALILEGATVSGPLFMESAMLQGLLDLTAARTSSYHDNLASWPQQLRLDGFVYDRIEGVPATERLAWLHRNEQGYSPQIYSQLAAVYRRAGHDEDARRILIAKQRRRFAQGNGMSKLGGFLLYVTVGYGYRTWLAGVWLVGLLALGTYLFGFVYASDFSPVSKTTTSSPFQPFLYTLDLLLPVASLHQRDGWIANGPAQWWSVFFIVMGWILATAIVLSLTGLLKRD